VLVTGGAGFIGANLVRMLLDHGYQVIVLDNLSTGRREYLEGLPIEFVEGDILDGDLVNRVYLTCFVLGTFNRETTVFLIPFFIMALYKQIDSKLLLMAAGTQLATFAAIQTALQVFLASNVSPYADIGGTPFEFHAYHNSRWLAHPMDFVTFMARFAGGLYIPVLLFRRYLSEFLRAALLWFGIPYFIVAFTFGWIHEYRVYITLLPLIWLSSLQCAVTWHQERDMVYKRDAL
jgi:hypothetical protein